MSLASIFASGPIDYAIPLSLNEFLQQFALVILFVLLNGFFVAVEFALVKLRGSQLESHISDGKKAAVRTKLILENLDAYLSACQLGITIASLVLGRVGEPLVARLIHGPLTQMGVKEAHIVPIAFTVGIAVITVAHVVIGEQMPKILAIRKAAGTAMLLSGPLRLFYIIFKWPVVMLNWAATLLMKVIFRIDAVDSHEMIHSAEELRILVEETEAADDVTDTEREILINALALNDMSVRDIMTPRNDVICYDLDRPFDENIEEILDSKHTRFPAVRGHLDKASGLIHIKDIVTEIRKPSDERIVEGMIRELHAVPELMALDDVLKQFLEKHAHMFIVVDEFGGALGLVMLDDVLEELVGEIQDEFDEANDEFRKVSDNEFVASGSMSLQHLTHLTDLEFDNPDVSTVGGYVTHVIGHLPNVGETARIADYEVKVTESDDRSIGEVHFRRMTPEEIAEELRGGDDLPEAPDSVT